MNLLIIEDNSLDLEIISIAISELKLNDDISIQILKSKNDILNFLNSPKTTIDVILSDMNLIEINGLEIIKMFKNEKYQDVPYIFFTSSLYEEEVEEAYLNGASDYIIKPESFEDNCKVIKKIFEVYGK